MTDARPRRSDRAALLIALLALAGAGVSAYLTWTHYAHQAILCAGLGSCATVNSSEYAVIGGVPVAALGLGAYLAMAALTLRGGDRAWALPMIVLFAATGTLYSLYLTWVELTILHAVCLWCATSAVLVTLITALATWRLLAAPPAPAMPARRPRPARG